mgnify:CR=1 FL=1
MANINRNIQAARPSAPTTFSTFMTQTGVRAKLKNMLGEQKALNFITSIVTSVNKNPDLVRCDRATVLSAALEGAALDLSPSSTLGYFYLVPYKDNKNNRQVAQFQIGYKGYIQLAIRSGQYKKINVLAIKQGELMGYNPLTEELSVNIEENDEIRESLPTIGYYAMFEMVNGFTKSMYCSKEKMEAHALKYSKGYKAKKGYTFWEKDFDSMAYKTMLRQLLSKWGAMSIEMTRAVVNDMGVMDEKGTPQYIDNDEVNDVETAQPVTTEEVQESDPTSDFFDD